jgi:hypothetical protein
MAMDGHRLEVVVLSRTKDDPGACYWRACHRCDFAIDLKLSGNLMIDTRKRAAGTTMKRRKSERLSRAVAVAAAAGSSSSSTTAAAPASTRSRSSSAKRNQPQQKKMSGPRDDSNKQQQQEQQKVKRPAASSSRPDTAAAPNYFNLLDDNCRLKIFSCLTWQDLAEAAQTSKVFRDDCRHPSLTQNADRQMVLNVRGPCSALFRRLRAMVDSNRFATYTKLKVVRGGRLESTRDANAVRLWGGRTIPQITSLELSFDPSERPDIGS